MSGFDDRQKSFEAKFHHNQELLFRIKARRNKLTGLWAAAKLGKSGADAEAYAMEVVKADFEEVGDEDVIRKLMGDLGPKGVSENDVRARLLEIQAEVAETLSAS